MTLFELFDHSISIEMSQTLKSQIEMSFWQVFPGLVMLVFMAGGVSQFWLSQRRRRSFKQKQRYARQKMALPMVINTPITQEFSVNTFDISLTGAFLAYDDLKHSTTFTSLVGKRSGIKVGDLVDIKVYTGRYSQFKCQAKVIRYNFDDKLPPPKGIGIEFVNLSQRKKRILESIIENEALKTAA